LLLLYDNLRSHDVSHPILSRYKSVYWYVWLQNQLQSRQAVEVLEFLADGLLLKGIALIPLYYRRFGLRSMDDIDVLARPETGGRAIDTLRRAGWRVKAPDWRARDVLGTDKAKIGNAEQRRIANVLEARFEAYKGQ
jgi:hypothetical protein